MTRYRKIARPLNGSSGQFGGEHTGVYDSRKNTVHEVVTPDQQRAEYREISLQEFKQGKQVYTKSTLSKQSSDAEIEKRLEGLKTINKKHYRYDPTGEKGVNCEHVQEWAMTGKSQSKQGDRYRSVPKPIRKKLESRSSSS